MNSNTPIKHLNSIEDLSIAEIEHLIDKALFFKNSPLKDINKTLSDKFCFNMFFENSTRTINSFSVAAQSLGAHVINNTTSNSSSSKGEDDFDTIKNIAAMGAKFIVIRHPHNMFTHLCAKLPNLTHQPIFINAGDGTNEHPTQALGDWFLINQHCKNLNKNTKELKIVLFGDLLNSRVAHSHIKLFNMLNINHNIHLVAPIELQLDYRQTYPNLNYSFKLNESIKDADIIMAFRFKKEYTSNNIHSGTFSEFKNFYQLNHQNIHLANKNVLVLHPGPVNREIELSSKLMDDLQYSQILSQVSHGVAMRKAIFAHLAHINNH